jgi:hypothetical protein
MLQNNRRITTVKFRDVSWGEIVPCYCCPPGEAGEKLWESRLRGSLVSLIAYRTDNPCPTEWACEGPWWLTDLIIPEVDGGSAVCAHMIEID